MKYVYFNYAFDFHAFHDLFYITIYILKIKRLERNAMRKKKGEKTKSLLFQSNISKTRYNKKRLILNLLLDSLRPIMMKHGGKTKSRKILLPSRHNNKKKGVQERRIDKSIVTSPF